MKVRLTILITLLFVASAAYSQSKKTEIFHMRGFLLTEHVSLQTGDTRYVLMGHNHRYTQIVDMWTIEESNNLEDIIRTLDEFETFYNKYEVDVSMGTDRFFLANQWVMGGKWISISPIDKAEVYTQTNDRLLQKMKKKMVNYNIVN